MIYDICSIADAMSWLACISEIKDRETLTRALKSRREIHSRLLKDNREVAQHFFNVSLSALNAIKDNL